VWNGIFDHYGRIGNAIWVFLWLVDRVTEERNSVGIVLGGRPVKIRELVESIKGCTYQRVRDQLYVLEQNGYITKKRTAYGFVIRVLNSRKWGSWAREEIVPPGQSEICPGEQSKARRLVPRTAQIGPADQNKEDKAIHSSAAAFWKALGVNPETLPPSFRRHTEEFCERRGDQTTVELAGAVMDGWTALGNRIPAPFAKATSVLRRQGSASDESVAPILEVESWAR
jgi:hypothetical protein